MARKKAKKEKPPMSDGKLLAWSIVMIFLFFPVGIGMLIYYFKRKSNRYVPPVVPWSAWGETIHESRPQADRMQRALSQGIKVKRYSSDGRAVVQGASGNVYNTTFGGCTCDDFRKRGRPCKHMYALAIAKAGFDPSPYLWFADDK